MPGCLQRRTGSLISLTRIRQLTSQAIQRGTVLDHPDRQGPSPRDRSRSGAASGRRVTRPSARVTCTAMHAVAGESVPPGHGVRRGQRRRAEGRDRPGRHWSGPHRDGPRHRPRDGHRLRRIRLASPRRRSPMSPPRGRQNRLQPHGRHHQGRPGRQTQAAAERAVRRHHHPGSIRRHPRGAARPAGHGLALRLPGQPHYRGRRGVPPRPGLRGPVRHGRPCAASGTVTFTGWHPFGGGNRVVIDHGNGLETTYNHLSSLRSRSARRFPAVTSSP